jgi:hypothetical protein
MAVITSLLSLVLQAQGDLFRRLVLSKGIEMMAEEMSKIKMQFLPFLRRLFCVCSEAYKQIAVACALAAVSAFEARKSSAQFSQGHYIVALQQTPRISDDGCTCDSPLRRRSVSCR